MGHTMVWISLDVPYDNVDGTYFEILLIERPDAVELAQLRKNEYNAQTGKT